MIRHTTTFACIFKANPGLRSLLFAIHRVFEVAHDRTQRTLAQLLHLISSYVVLKLLILSRANVFAVNFRRCLFYWGDYQVNIDSPSLLLLALTGKLFLITMLFRLDRLQMFNKLLLYHIIRLNLSLALVAPGSAVVMAVPRKRAASTRTSMRFLVQ